MRQHKGDTSHNGTASPSDPQLTAHGSSERNAKFTFQSLSSLTKTTETPSEMSSRGPSRCNCLPGVPLGCNGLPELPSPTLRPQRCLLSGHPGHTWPPSVSTLSIHSDTLSTSGPNETLPLKRWPCRLPVDRLTQEMQSNQAGGKAPRPRQLQAHRDSQSPLSPSIQAADLELNTSHGLSGFVYT